jgi:hypothetical protein
LLSREIQAGHAAEIEESVLTRAYEPKQDMATNRTPRNESRTIHIQMSIGKAPLRSAICTLSLGGGQPTRLLCICSPAGQENFFIEVGTPVATRTTPPPKLDEKQQAEFIQKVKTFAPKYRTELLRET